MITENLAIEWVDVVVKLVTAGGFGALVWYLVVKHIPLIEERHRVERNEWKDFIANRDESLKLVISNFVSEVKESREEMMRLKNEIQTLNNKRTR